MQKIFQNYYIQNYTVRSDIPKIEQREFGFVSFEGWMLRHKSFENVNELNAFLQAFTPSDAYYSCAYYEYPEAEMNEKKWLGADLIFDIDADHIPTPCNKIHDQWTCSNCNFSGKGITPEKCPVCASEKINVNTWPCEVCLESAKEETVKLLDMLTQDFGFSEKEIRLFFSGHRGYHVLIESQEIKDLDAIARKEIVDYVSGLGLDISKLGFHSSTLFNCGAGWNKRLIHGINEFIGNASVDDLIIAGLNKKLAETVLRNKETIQTKLKANSPPSVKGIGLETWKKIMEHVMKLQSAKIDTVVTTDVHRLIRLTDTLHGKTGFKKVEFPYGLIHDFDPFKEAIAFKGGTVTVSVSDAPEFRLGDEMFGPYKNQRVELPTAAAVLLVCKDRAEVVE